MRISLWKVRSGVGDDINDNQGNPLSKVACAFRGKSSAMSLTDFVRWADEFNRGDKSIASLGFINSHLKLIGKRRGDDCGWNGRSISGSG